MDFSKLGIIKTDRRYTREGSSGGPDFEINSIGSSHSNDSDSSFSKMLRFVSEHLGYHAEPNSVSRTTALLRHYASTHAPFRVVVEHVKTKTSSMVMIADSMTMKDIIKACVEKFKLPEPVVRTACLRVSVKDRIVRFELAKELEEDDVILFMNQQKRQFLRRGGCLGRSKKFILSARFSEV